MRPMIFSCMGCSNPPNIDSISDLVVEVWKVATMGPSAIRNAHIDTLGAFGSCRCRHVEVAVGQPAPDLAADCGADLQAGHRAVVGNRDRPAGRHYVFGQYTCGEDGASTLTS